jgi:hypothetical protein
MCEGHFNQLRAMKTERIVVLVSRERAKEVARRANIMGVSVGEYVRKAIDAFASGEEAEEFAALCKQLHESIALAKASMKRLS